MDTRKSISRYHAISCHNKAQEAMRIAVEAKQHLEDGGIFSEKEQAEIEAITALGRLPSPRTGRTNWKVLKVGAYYQKCGPYAVEIRRPVFGPSNEEIITELRSLYPNIKFTWGFATWDYDYARQWAYVAIYAKEVSCSTTLTTADKVKAMKWEVEKTSYYTTYEYKMLHGLITLRVRDEYLEGTTIFLDGVVRNEDGTLKKFKSAIEGMVEVVERARKMLKYDLNALECNELKELTYE